MKKEKKGICLFISWHEQGETKTPIILEGKRGKVKLPSRWKETTKTFL